MFKVYFVLNLYNIAMSIFFRQFILRKFGPFLLFRSCCLCITLKTFRFCIYYKYLIGLKSINIRLDSGHRQDHFKVSVHLPASYIIYLYFLLALNYGHVAVAIHHQTHFYCTLSLIYSFKIFYN